MGYDQDSESHYVYEPPDKEGNGTVIYRGSYIACLVVLGYFYQHGEYGTMEKLSKIYGWHDLQKH